MMVAAILRPVVGVLKGWAHGHGIGEDKFRADAGGARLERGASAVIRDPDGQESYVGRYLIRNPEILRNHGREGIAGIGAVSGKFPFAAEREKIGHEILATGLYVEIVDRGI